MAITTIKDVRDSMITEIAAVLPSFGQLAYLIDVERNSALGNNDRYGVRPLASTETDGTTKHLTYLQTYEIVLTKSYNESSISDSVAIDKALELMDLMLDLYKRLESTRAGLPSKVYNVLNLSMQEPEYLTDEKVVVIRGNVNILIRESQI